MTEPANVYMQGPDGKRAYTTETLFRDLWEPKGWTRIPEAPVQSELEREIIAASGPIRQALGAERAEPVRSDPMPLPGESGEDYEARVIPAFATVNADRLVWLFTALGHGGDLNDRSTWEMHRPTAERAIALMKERGW